MAEARCRCGQVAIEISGPPIVSPICCCASCQAAGRALEQAPGAPAGVRPDGGTEYCLYRKDRVRVVASGAHLSEHRLTPDSPTRRVAAGCCATPMFADFTRGHWVSIYRDRISGAPPPEFRVMAGDAPTGADLDDGLPTYPAYPARMMFRLMAAWARMGFKRPELGW